jgi:hypothetical protein
MDATISPHSKYDREHTALTAISEKNGHLAYVLGIRSSYKLLTLAG